MTKLINLLCLAGVLGMTPGVSGQTKTARLPPPVVTMTGTSKPLVAPPPASLAPHMVMAPRQTGTPVTTAVNMKILVLAGDLGEYSYVSMAAYLDQMGVPYQGIGVDTLTPDASGNRLSGLTLTDPATGRGLYQGFIYTNSSFGVCNPTCVNLLSTADWNTLSAYTAQYNVRVVTYYTYPEPKWGLSIVGSGASYLASAPLNLSLTPAGASIFSYINKANAVPVSGSGTGGIYAYLAAPVASAGETTTPILTAGANVAGVTHVNAAGQESMSLTMDNYPSLLHSLAFSYGVINWVTKGVFLGQHQVYLNPQIDDILFGDRLYAPTLPQCPNDPSCPTIIGTSADVQGLANWQVNKHHDPQLTNIKSTFVYVGLGSTPGFAPVPDTVTPAMKAFALDFGWITHTWTHGNLDCYSLAIGGACQPATFDQSLFEIEQNAVFAKSLGLPDDTTGVVTPFNGGLTNLAFLQAAAQQGITSVISPNNPPGPGVGMPSLVPSVLLIPRRATNLFYDADSPLTGVPGSLPDEYNALYGPNGTTPAFATNQTYSQIIDNESTMLLQLRLLTYEPFPLAFHNSNAIFYDGVHSLMTDLFDATFTKYEKLYNLPVNSLTTMRDIAPQLLNRAGYNSSGVTGVYTPGISVVLTTLNAAVIPVTGACSQAVCPTYGNQMQDRVAMPANSSVTLALSAGVGVGLSSITVNPGTVNTRTPSQGLVMLSGIATGKVTVTLSSDNAALVVPSSIIINAGDAGAAFTVTTGLVTSPVTGHITATYNSVAKTVSLGVIPAVALSGISLSSPTVAAGGLVTATVLLTAPAPAGGITVSLLSNNAAVVLPSGIAINGGSSGSTFNVSTLAVGTATAGNLVAVYNGVNALAPLTVTPGTLLALSGVTLDPTAVIGGSVSTGTVTLNGLAPSGGVAIALSSNNSAAVVPATVFVNFGSSTATFTVKTTAVSATVNATIGATYKAGPAVTSVLTVARAFGLSGVSLLPSSVIGGSPSQGTVTLTGAAPAGGIVVTLLSNNAAAVIPASVTVSAGNVTGLFAITTSSVTVSTVVTVSATYSGVTVPASLTVSPALSLSGVSVTPASVSAGSASMGTVTLTGAAPAGGVVIVLSSNSAAVTAPASVSVIAGSSSAPFAVSTTGVASSVVATISAAYGGATKTTALTVNPAVSLSGLLTLNPASVTSGSSSTATVSLAAPAPAGGISVTLSSNSAGASVPANVVVAAGSSSATFTVSTNAVVSSTIATISAAYAGLTESATLTIIPAVALSGLSVNAASVTAGTSATGTVTLTAAAPAAGIVVSLNSSNAAAKVPATVTVSSGNVSATFAIATSSVAANTVATIGATYNLGAKTFALTVTPGIAISGITLNPASVTGGTSSTGTVNLTGVAPAGGVTVSLTSSSGAGSVPAVVTVIAGSTSAQFTVTTNAVVTSTNTTLTAAYGGVSKTAILTVTAPVLSGLTLSPSYLEGKGSSVAKVTLSGPAPAGGVVVQLSSDNGFIANVQQSVTIPAGSSSATFTVWGSPFFFTWNATITATYSGVSQTAVLTVEGFFDWN